MRHVRYTNWYHHSRQNTTSTSGDLGGGLIARRFDGNFLLLGVTSFAECSCGKKRGRPGVYTNVLSHAAWIRNIIGGDKEEICTTKDGRICQFPFTFQGTKYTECTAESDPHDRLWCSTKVDDNGDHVQNEGQWGHCSSECQDTKVTNINMKTQKKGQQCCNIVTYNT